MQAIKQFTEVINGSIHVSLPENFTAKRVELIILSVDEDNTDSSDFRPVSYTHLDVYKRQVFTDAALDRAEHPVRGLHAHRPRQGPHAPGSHSPAHAAQCNRPDRDADRP